MSRPDLNAFAVGFFGKLPCAGDFVARGLEANVRETLDQFLANGMAQLQRECRDGWSAQFATGFGWRWFAPAGVIGRSACCGVVCASRDQVGRLFPVVGLVALPRPAQALALSQVMETTLDGFEACFAAALQGELTHVDDVSAELENGYALARLRQASEQIPPLHRSPLKFPPGSTPAEMAASLWIEQIGSGQSCWWRRRVDAAHFLVFAGLPSPTQFAQMLLIESEPATVESPAGAPPAMPEPEPVASPIGVHRASEESVLEQSWQEYIDPLGHVKLLFEDDETVSTGLVQPTADAVETVSGSQCSALPDPPGSNEVNSVADCAVPVIEAEPVRVFALSETGKVRTINEDSYWVDQQQQFWMVADGLGGLEQGDVASWAIVEACRGLLLDGDIFERTAQLKAALQAVNQELFELNHQQSVRSGSTVVAALRCEDQCSVLWAGDSRLYRCSCGRLEQLTRDHTDVDDSSHRHSLSRAVGVGPELELDVRFFPVQPGDRLLLCSDGVYNFIGPHSLRQAATIIGAEACGKAVRERVDSTEASDNYTLIVIDIAEGAA